MIHLSILFHCFLHSKGSTVRTAPGIGRQMNNATMLASTRLPHFGLLFEFRSPSSRLISRLIDFRVMLEFFETEHTQSDSLC